MSSALVTLLVGEKYKEFYDIHFRPSHERYAKKIGVPLIIIDELVDKSEFGEGKAPSWHKLLVFKHPKLHGIEQICWLDADIFITEHSSNVFNEIPLNYWAGVKNDLRGMEYYQGSDQNELRYCPKENRPDYLINGGFFVANRKEHAADMERIFYDYPNDLRSWEQGPLSYYWKNKQPGKELDYKYNVSVISYIVRTGSYINSFKKLYNDNYFIHFCGGTAKDHLAKLLLFDSDYQPSYAKLAIAKGIIADLLYYFNSLLTRAIKKIKR